MGNLDVNRDDRHCCKIYVLGKFKNVKKRNVSTDMNTLTLMRTETKFFNSNFCVCKCITITITFEII